MNGFFRHYSQTGIEIDRQSVAFLKIKPVQAVSELGNRL